MSKKISTESLKSKKIVESFVEHTVLWVAVLILISIILLFIGAYYHEKNPLISTALTSAGSALFGIGCISLVFRSASSYLFEREKIKEAVERTIKRMYHTYIPKISVEDNEIEITITANKSNEYLFSWDSDRGVDREKLIRFLVDFFDIDWAENAEIRKSDDGKTLHIFKDENFAKIIINKKEEEATLNISDGRTYDLKVKMENGKLNIYHDCPKMVISKYRSLINNLEKIITQQRITTALPKGQTLKFEQSEVHFKDKIFKLTEKEIKIDHARVTNEKGKVTGEQYVYILPFNVPLGQGERITIKENYEWAPCKALPGTDESDCFCVKLAFPTENLQIRLKADSGFYFKEVKKKVIGWGGEETCVQSAPTAISASDDGKLTEFHWVLKEEELSHQTEYCLSFKLNKR